MNDRAVLIHLIRQGMAYDGRGDGKWTLKWGGEQLRTVVAPAIGLAVDYDGNFDPRDLERIERANITSPARTDE